MNISFAEREREKLKEISRREMEMRKSRKDKDPENETGERERSRSQERIRHRNEDGPPKGICLHSITTYLFTIHITSKRVFKAAQTILYIKFKIKDLCIQLFLIVHIIIV